MNLNLLFIFLLLHSVILATPVVETVAGTGRKELNLHRGSADKVNIADPFGVEFGPNGRLHITEVGNHRILSVDLKSGRVQCVVGTGMKGYSGDGGPAIKADLNEPYEVRFDKA